MHIMKTINKLLRTPRPYFDESFMGYMLRLTEHNGYDSISWILSMAGVDYNLYNNNLSCIKLKDFTTLSEIIGINSSELNNMIYHLVQSEGIFKKYIVYGHSIPNYMLCFSNPKICPYCLRQSGYIHKIWDISAVTVCPTHKCILIDECPNCKKPINWRRNHLSICECKFDWCNIISQPINEIELTFSMEIYNRCGFITKDKEKEKSLNINPLDDLSLEDMLYVICLISGHYYDIDDPKGKSLFKSFRNAELHAILTKAFYVFGNWPEKFYAFLDYIRVPDAENNHKKDFGRLYIAICENFQSEKYLFLRNAFIKYLNEQGLDSFHSNHEDSAQYFAQKFGTSSYYLINLFKERGVLFNLLHNEIINKNGNY